MTTGLVNRHRKGRTDKSVSPTLLQKHYEELRVKYNDLEAEAQQVRNVLFAVVKEQGRVRVSKSVIDSLVIGSCLDVRDTPDAYIIQLNEGNSVVPGGVQPKESA